MIDFIELNWPLLIFGAFAAYFGYQIYRNKGFKNALFGAKQLAEIGEVEGRKRAGVRSLLRVHRMQDPETGENVIGIELVQKAPLSYSMQPITITKIDAKRLSTLLESAAKDDT